MHTLNMFNAEAGTVRCPRPHHALESSVASTLDEAAICALLLAPEHDHAGALAAAHACLAGHDRAGVDALAVSGQWLDDLLARLPSDEATTAQQTLGAAESRFLLTQYAPQGLLSGCVLQNIAHAGNCHEAVALLGHRVHAWQAGEGVYAQHHAVAYRRLLEQANVYLPDTGSERLTAHADILAASWSLPAYRLSLAQFPAARQGEILGAALFEVAVGVPQLLLCAEQALALDALSTVRATPRREQALECLRQAVHALVSDADTGASAVQQVCQGFVRSLQLWRDWQDTVVGAMNGHARSARQAMIRMVADKGRFAVGYHSRVKIQSQSFDDLVVRDPVAFVDALACSRWVTPGKPEKSFLLTRLIAFGGPMFRIFSDTEIEVMTRWIEALPEAGQQPDANGVSVAARGLQLVAPTPSIAAVEGGRYRPEERARALYHQLLNIEGFPQAHGEALRYAQVWLGRCAARPLCPAGPPPVYTRGAFRHWFEARALQQVQAFDPIDGKIEKSREEVIDEAVQICPMILADGAWIQRWTHAGLADTPIGALLYKTLSDEIGNGVAEYNHPNIYRDLMREMGVTLPDFRSEEFSQLPLFDDEAFLVPAFWLSISLFPRRFLPETLGLNLAMELSGVGGAYRAASAELHHYGFSTLFVDLHNTIDNVSSGHSAMAAEAIELYMDDFVRAGAPEAIARQWRRIKTGFAALAPPKAGWKELFAAPLYVV
jgi:hypothetical protein